MREVYTYIQLNCYLHPPGKLWHCIATIATTSSRNRTHWQSLLLTFSGTWQLSTATREAKTIMILDTLNISHLNNIRDADSRAGSSLTTNWWCNSVCTKPLLPWSFHCLPSQDDFLLTRLEIGYHGASLHANSAPRIKLGAVLSSIRGSNVSGQHADSTLRKLFLCVPRGWCTKTWTQATAPFTSSWLIATPSRDTLKTGCNSDGPLTTDSVNWKTLKQHTCKLKGRPTWLLHTMILNLCKFWRERNPGWLQNAKTYTCRCWRTKEWNSAFAGSISDPLTQPNSSGPSSCCPK